MAECTQEPKALKLANVIGLLRVVQALRVKPKREVRVGVRGLLALRERGRGGSSDGGVDINIKGLGIIRPSDGRDVHKGLLKTLEGCHKPERSQNLLRRRILCLKVMEWREHVVASFNESGVEANHASETPSRSRIVTDGLASHVKERA